MKLGLLLLFSMLNLFSFAQGYKPFNAEFFNVGDSLRVDVRYVFDYCWGLDESETRSKDADSLLSFLKAQPGISICINVHTDSKGSTESNKVLSVGRANSMRNWLVKEGIDPMRCSPAIGWGEGKPIVSEREINSYRKTDRKKFDSLHMLNRRLTVVIGNIRHKSNCHYPRTTEQEYLKYYRTDDVSTFQVGDRFRLDFVKFDMDKITISNFEEDREKYLELARFIHCNKDLKFNVIAHSDSKNGNIHFTSMRAKALKKQLVDAFYIDTDQLVASGYGSNNPIIPQMIIDQFEDSKEDQEAFHHINRRIELEIADVQQSNEYRIDKTTKITDLEATKPVLYRGRTHTMEITTQNSFDSIQVIASETASIQLKRASDRRWILTIITNTDKEKMALSVKGCNGNQEVFLTRKIFEIAHLKAKSIFLGEHKLRLDVIDSLSDKALFSSKVFTCKYDTTEVFLNTRFEIQQLYIRIGKRTLILEGNEISKEVMEQIEKAKSGIIILFEGYSLQKGLLTREELNVPYRKKSEKKTALFGLH